MRDTMHVCHGGHGCSGRTCECPCHFEGHGKTYDYIQDPGHGWLKVPLADLPDGFKPTTFSFRDTRFAYLEEDCDATKFAKLVPKFNVREVIVDNFNRNRRRFA